MSNFKIKLAKAIRRVKLALPKSDSRSGELENINYKIPFNDIEPTLRSALSQPLNAQGQVLIQLEYTNLDDRKSYIILDISESYIKRVATHLHNTRTVKEVDNGAGNIEFETTDKIKMFLLNRISDIITDPSNFK